MLDAYPSNRFHLSNMLFCFIILSLDVFTIKKIDMKETTNLVTAKVQNFHKKQDNMSNRIFSRWSKQCLKAPELHCDLVISYHTYRQLAKYD